MAYNLTYNDLPEKLDLWQGLPLSLSGDEVIPLDYRSGKTGWVLYGKKLGKKVLSAFQLELGKPIVIVTAWKIKSYHVVYIAGELTTKAKSIAEKLALDIASIDNIPSLRSPGLLVMDMDSTAITIECIDEIAMLAGVGDQVSNITEKAMRGDIDFSTSLRKRVALLKGLDISILEKVKENLPLTSGLNYLINQLRKKGWHIAIASGGFTYYAEYLKHRLKLYEISANQLGIKQGKLTGRIVGPIVDAKYKAEFIKKLAEKLNIPLTQTIAIGDGANDLKMLQVASLGIAYHAKPKVVTKSKTAIKFADLTGVLCILSANQNNEQ